MILKTINTSLFLLLLGSTAMASYGNTESASETSKIKKKYSLERTATFTECLETMSARNGVTVEEVAGVCNILFPQAEYQQDNSVEETIAL